MGKKLENILTKKNPEYIKEWDFEKNDSLGFSIEKLTTGSNEKVWWKCTNGHEWITSIKSRTNGSLCPEGALVTHLKGKTTNSAGLHWHYLTDQDTY